MFVLGIDPGLSRCGYGVVEQIPAAKSRPSRNEAVALGVIRTDHTDAHATRLAVQMRELESLIGEFQPSVVAVERVFFQVNARTAIGVAQVAGLAMALAAASGAEAVEYTPTQVKQAVAGWGGADKDQMKRMVGQLLALPGPPEPADAADAVAVALCHLSQAPWRSAEINATPRVLAPVPSADTSPSSTS